MRRQEWVRVWYAEQNSAVLTNSCHSVGCKFEVENGKVEIGE